MRFQVALLSIALAGGAAAETVTHTYDALGRLVASTYTGGPRAGKQAALNYDPAGNRTWSAYGVESAPPPDPPTPDPPPTVPAPVANLDSVTVRTCGIVTTDVVANDTDPGGRYPIVLVSAGTSSAGAASVVGGSLQFDAGRNAGSTFGFIRDPQYSGRYSHGASGHHDYGGHL